MLTRRLIPSLLLRGGRLVKGVQFKDYRDAGMPDTTARAHNAQGADELILSSHIHDEEARLRSYEIGAEVREQLSTAKAAE